MYLCNAIEKSMRAFSSAGSEHLPYKQRVGGSNPSTPTTENQGVTENVAPFFVTQKLVGLIHSLTENLNRELNRELFMNVGISVICYKSKTLKNGEHPLMLRVCKDRF